MPDPRQTAQQERARFERRRMESGRQDPVRAAPPPDIRTDQPRIVEEHPVVGPYGEQEIEAVDERGRRWRSLRPQPARGYDLLGFGFAWWVLLWLIVIGFVIWAWGWGW